jgi:TolB-like protein
VSARARRAALAIGLASALALLAGCGYGLAGRTSVLPAHVKSINVTPFENRTQRVEIEQRITEEIASELVKRGRYTLVADRELADAVLEGAVVDYREQPVQFTSEGRTTRVEAVVSLAATLRDVTNDEILWSQSGLLFREQYDVPEGGEFIDEASVALDEIASGAAEALVASILEGF